VIALLRWRRAFAIPGALIGTALVASWAYQLHRFSVI
jgi:hypothetical protein